MGTLPSSLKRGDPVEVTAMGYMGKRGILDYPAVPTKSGIERWYVIFIGSHTKLGFRVDEFRKVENG
jgi:hypothetical protein